MKVIIIGGGIAGLATAYALQKQAQERELAVEYSLFEQSDRLGGKIQSVRQDDFLIESGPDSFLVQKPWATELCRELGIGEDLLPANTEQRNVYVVHHGKLIQFPAGYRLAVPTEFMPFIRTPLLSWCGKARVGLDLFLPKREAGTDESLGGFLRRRLGREAAERLAGPIMSGIYTADPERLSMQATWPMFIALEQKHRSLIRGMLAMRKARKSDGPPPAMFTSLRGGMEELVHALVGALSGDLKTNCGAESIRRRDGRSWIVTDMDGVEHFADAVVLATPASIAAGFVEPVDHGLANQLTAIRYVSTATVSLGYSREALGSRKLDGYGFLVPTREGRSINACTWASTKFAHRAPDDQVLIRGFVGGEGREHLVDLPDDELVDLVRRELEDLMGVRGGPIARNIFRWPKGNPQYDVGHLDRVSQIEDTTKTIPGLYLTGSSYRGVSVPDCIRQAQETAVAVMTNDPPSRCACYGGTGEIPKHEGSSKPE